MALHMCKWLLVVALSLLAVAGLARAQKLSPSRCALLSGKDRSLCARLIGGEDSFSKYVTANEWARYATASCE